jgi:hypothetical protein
VIVEGCLGCLGCLAWLAVAFGLAVLLGRAIRLADRRSTARNRAVGHPFG